MENMTSAEQAMRKLIGSMFILAAISAAPSAAAQVYKWVDANGVTNYSGEPPLDAGAAKGPEIVAERISVYPPDPGVLKAIEAGRQNVERALSDRVGRLERELEAERQARQYAAAAEARASQAAYERCVAERRIDCDGYGSGRLDPYPAVVVVFARRRPIGVFNRRFAADRVTAGSAAPAIHAAPEMASGNFVAFRPGFISRGSRGF